MRRNENRSSHLQIRRGGRRSATQAGSVALEFAILLPFLLMVLVGIVEVGLMIYDKAALAAAARAAARAGTMVAVPALSAPQISAVASANCNDLLSFGNAGNSPSVTVNNASGTSPGNTLTVRISYTYRGLMLGSVFSALTGPVVLNATAVMTYE
jgi:Flp pilus assembly protein TadG